MKKEQDIMKMIVSIVGEPEIFYDLKESYSKFINNFLEQIDPNKTPLHNTSEIYRAIHTYKGSFSQLHIYEVVNFLHNLESEISKLSKDISHTNQQLVSLLKSYDFQKSFERD